MDDKSVVVSAFERAVEGILDQAASTVLSKMKLEQLRTELEIEKLSTKKTPVAPLPKTRKKKEAAEDEAPAPSFSSASKKGKSVSTQEINDPFSELD